MRAQGRGAAGRRSGLSGRMQVWGQTVVLVGLLGVCWLLVYGAGGTQTAFPHVFYLPILLAASAFGVVGGVTVGVVAMLLCGPVMPLDVAGSEPQQLTNWLVRGGFFTAVGGLAGASTVSLRRTFEARLTRQLHRELDLALSEGADGPDIEAEAAVEGDAWELWVRRALAEQSFRPVFQPIYALDDGRLLAVEALTRFDTQPSFAPDVWFVKAGEVGLGVELELAAIKAALETSGDLPATVALSVNASPAVLADERLLALLDWHAGRRLIVEVTEHAVVDDYPQLTAALAQLRARGVELAVDDAGAGFASLRHIVRLQPEYIKLDPSLTQDLGDDPVRRPLADCLVLFAHRTDSQLIVEGIETAEDLATWRSLGAHGAQGYLLGRPGPLPTDEPNEVLASPGVDPASHRILRAGR